MSIRFLEKIIRVEENFIQEETKKQVAKEQVVNLEKEHLFLEAEVEVENTNLDSTCVESQAICQGNAHIILQPSKGL